MSHSRPVELDTLTLSSAAALLRSGDLTSVSLVHATLKRAAERGTELAAISLLDSDVALAQAKAADEAFASEGTCAVRPLEGLPVLIKDNIHVQGLPNSAGTPSLLSFIPASDAPVVQRLRDAGAIIIGKSHMHELAYGISGFNPLATNGKGAIGVRNPYDPSRIAGGSSSGSGAALGARIVLAALGTDTGGSVRIPSAVNGVFGLRPTAGRYPQEGITPLSHTRDTAGPMAQSMHDIELMDRIIVPSEPLSAVPLPGLRLGLVSDFFHNLDEDTAALSAGALARLRAAGVELVDLDEPGFFQLYGLAGSEIVAYEAHDDLVAYLAKYHPSLTVESVIERVGSPDVKSLCCNLVIPRKYPAEDGSLVDVEPLYRRAMEEHRPALQRLYEETIAQHDLAGLLFPTVPQIAFPADENCSSLSQLRSFTRHTGPGSSSGMPGITFPVGLGPTTGMPVSLAIDGARDADRHLIAVGLAMEALFGRLPPPARYQRSDGGVN